MVVDVNAAFVDGLSHALWLNTESKAYSIRWKHTHLVKRSSALLSVHVHFIYLWRLHQASDPTAVTIQSPFNCRPIFFSRDFVVFVWHIFICLCSWFLSRSSSLAYECLFSLETFCLHVSIYYLVHSHSFVHRLDLAPMLLYIARILLFTSAKLMEFQKNYLTWLSV